jgi:hypothetical protein
MMYQVASPRQLLTDVYSWGPRVTHYVHIPRRSINQWLYVEILEDIFLCAVEFCHMTPYQLVAVCRRWRNVINGMTHLWTTLYLGTWTEIENVDLRLQRSGQSPLAVVIDPQRDSSNPSSDSAYAGLYYALCNSDRWQDLVIASTPTPEVFGSAIDTQKAKPMYCLTSLKLGEKCLNSATLTHLLDYISETAVHLSHICLLGSYAVSCFLQPQRHHILNSITTLIVDGRGISQPVSILPLLIHLRVFEASHLPLPNYCASTTLMFLSTLKEIKLRAVPIQWMDGREFKCLEDCTIIHAIGQRRIQNEIDLPCCRSLTYQGHPMSTLQHFHAPQIKKLVLKSHDTRRERVHQHLDRLCRKFSRIHTFHLTLESNEKHLIKVLNYMEPLQELVLSIVHPSSSWEDLLESLAAKRSLEDWRIFLESLVAKRSLEDWSTFEYDQEWQKWCFSRPWHTNVLPHLKYLGIQSPKGFSQSECLDNSPLLRLVAWTRAQLIPPLEHLKVWEGRGTTDDIVVDYISIEYLDMHHGISSREYDLMIVSGMVTQMLTIDLHNAPVFKQLHSSVLFGQLQTLVLRNLYDDTHILLYLEQIKDLRLWSSRPPTYSLDIDLPLVYTLQWLFSSYSSCSWMLGRTFKALKGCTLDMDGISNGLPQMEMPSCTRLKLVGSSVPYSFLSCPNVQILKLLPQSTIGEVVLKSLHGFLFTCSCLQELKIKISHCSGLGSTIQFVYCDAQEQELWKDIRSVKVTVYHSSDIIRSEFVNQIVRHQQHYAKWWKEFIVKAKPERVSLRAFTRILKDKKDI